MASLDELVGQYDEGSTVLQRAIINYKKTPRDRKSVEYLHKRHSELEELWLNLEKLHASITQHPDATDAHPFFAKNVHGLIKERMAEATEDIKKTLQSHAKTTAPTGTSALLRKQQQLIQLVKGMLTKLREDNIEHTPQYYAMKAKSIGAQWNIVQGLHQQLVQSASDLYSTEYNVEQYMEEEGEVMEQLVVLEEKAAQTPSQTSSSRQPLSLPNISLPTFDGNYSKWRSFRDLFTQIIHKRPLSAVEKLWHLKASLTGEAERLIRHLPTTDDSYSSAWEMLHNRYDNQRLLVGATIEKLIAQPKTTAEVASVQALKALHDTTKESLLALGAMGIDTRSWDPILMHILLKKVDKATLILFEQAQSDSREIPTISSFLKFLESRFQSLEAANHKNATSNKTVASAVVKGTKKDECLAGDKATHALYNCPTFLNWSMDRRQQFVKKHSLCFNCLKGGHTRVQCNAGKCRKCGRNHHTLLHNEHHTSTDAAKAANQQPRHSEGRWPIPTTVSSTSAEITRAPTALTATNDRNRYVLISTAMVAVKAANGQLINCRAILDSGSQISVVTTRLVQRLKLSCQPTSMEREGIGKGKRSTHLRINLELFSKNSNYSTRLEACVLPSIVSQQPSTKINTTGWGIPSTIMLADPSFQQPGHIDVLLGAEFFHEVLQPGHITLQKGLPTLQNTVFGWVVSGPITNLNLHQAACGIFTETERCLEKRIEQFWNIEEIESDERQQSAAEKQCEAHYSLHTTRDQTGRFIVRLPFTDDQAVLGESKVIATNRFYALERRLNKDKQLKSQYIQFMDEYERLGHMKQVNPDAIPSLCYFIPHHCIQRPESTTTKLRVVFDASAKTSSGISLNNILHNGPVVQSELFAILLRFRIPRFVFTADIEKMYRQVWVHPEDRKFQLIVWRRDAAEDIKYYELNTVTYGTRCAPYLATKSLQQLGQQLTQKYPLGAIALLNDFYVDDCLSVSDSLTSALETQNQITKILKEGSFNLRKWCANHPSLLQSVPTADQEVNLDFENDDVNTIKTLGLAWMPKADALCVKARFRETTKVTKRTIISDVSRIFDPLGLLAPIVVTAKIIIQRTWQLKLDWDDEVPEELSQTWSTFYKQLKALDNKSIPRQVFGDGLKSTVQLHTFVDASEKAYGAAVYIRSRTTENTIIVRLLCAKSRVAPLKTQTIPRLELCAALLGAQLTAKVKTELNLVDAPTYLWSDSQVVLAWVNSMSGAFHTFVANRVAKIQNLSDPRDWLHVQSKDNPADLLSRGSLPRDFLKNQVWFYGPMFLYQASSLWPKQQFNMHQDDSTLERKQIVAAQVIRTLEPADDLVYRINHKNSFRFLQNVMAYVLRFCQKSKKHASNQGPNLTPQELHKSLTAIMKAMQQTKFKAEIKALTKQERVSKSSSLSSLDPFLDEHGQIRVGGRLESAAISYSAKHPVILPYNDPLTKLLLQQIHQDHMHCGPQTLLAHARQRFWPIKGKTMARSVVQQCVRCTRAKPKMFEQIMGGLPRDRVQPARPFINSGVDFCGPFWIHYKIRGKAPRKAYVAIFCCFATKAVHLEVVSDLTTDAFIGCLKRFISRRGQCLNLYCDNATNFVGAKNQLSPLHQVMYSENAENIIKRVCNYKGIHFQFIPPRAPHFGGLWEAAVKSAKHLFVREVGNASLTYEELETIMVEIEAILNSRPLTPLSADPRDLAYLTPGHFLIGEPLTALVEPRAVPAKTTLLQRWKLVSHLKNEFWKRWSHEYLNELRFKNKWKEASKNVEPGMMVIIKEDNVPPLQWPIGRIVATSPGPDNNVRVVDVKTSSGVCRRPIHQLAPLPIAPTETTTPNAIPMEVKDVTTTTATPTPTTLDSSRVSTSCDNQTPKKKPRYSTFTVLFTLITSLLILPLVLCDYITVQNLTATTGIHFEQTGTIYMMEGDWNLIVYYDLQPLLSQVEFITKGVKLMKTLCAESKHAACDTAAAHLSNLESRLRTYNILLAPRRQKRGALDIVGSIAHSLFGLLDSEYAEKMSNTIDMIQDNDQHLLALFKNQTSILDSTLNIIKRDQKEALQEFSRLNQQIAHLSNRLQLISTDDSINLMSMAIQLTVMMTDVLQIQNALMAVLIDVHHNQISPMLLTPRQLFEEITKIMIHLPSGTLIPAYNGDLLSIYKIMNVKAGITKRHAVFRITIPLASSDLFTLFRVIPIPTMINNTMTSIKSSTPMLAVSRHWDHYFPMDFQTISSCKELSKELYLCPHLQPLFGMGSTAYACEIGLLNNQAKPACALEETVSESWIQLRNNRWLYALSHKRQITAICNDTIATLLLQGSGLLTISPVCVLKHADLTIKGTRTLSSTINASYTSTVEFEGLMNPAKTERPKESTHQEYKPSLDNVTTLQEALKTQMMAQLRENYEGRHHHAISLGYTALVLALAAPIVYIIYKWWYKRTRDVTQQPNTLAANASAFQRTSSAPELILTFGQGGGEC